MATTTTTWTSEQRYVGACHVYTGPMQIAIARRSTHLFARLGPKGGLKLHGSFVAIYLSGISLTAHTHLFARLGPRARAEAAQQLRQLVAFRRCRRRLQRSVGRNLISRHCFHLL